MTTAIERPTRVAPVERAPSAVVYIDRSHAVVVRTMAGASVAITDVKRRLPDDLSFLFRVADQIGERRRVAIVGPDDLRLELEREYVSLYHRPDLLVDVERGEATPVDDLIGRLAELAS
jgi:hypothetical protein